MIKKRSEINIKIGNDENNNPESISWVATDSGVQEDREVKAMMLSFWDVKENNSMRIDLWNKDLMVEEMYYFVYQNIISMSEPCKGPLMTRSYLRTCLILRPILLKSRES